MTEQEMPQVLNKRTNKIPPDAIYVGRPSKWGNPWRIGEKHPADGHRLNRDEVIRVYSDNIHLMLKAKRADGSVILDLNELKGKDLVCWCAPLSCHADILLELANKSLPKAQD